MKRLAIIVVLAVAAIAAASAAAATLPDLPGLGYTLAAENPGGTCTYYYASGNGADHVLLGSNDLNCTDPHVLQANIDALVAAYPPAAAPAPPSQSPPTDPPPAPGPSTADLAAQIADLQRQITVIQNELVQLVRVLEQWPGIDPGILAALMALGSS